MRPPAATAPTRPPAVRLVVTVLLGAVAAALLVAPLPAYVQRPGPAIGLAGRLDLPGGTPADGDYLFTTVRLDDATVASALAAALDGEASVVSRRAVLGEESEDAFVDRQVALFHAAERVAVRLGLQAVGSDLDPAAVTLEGEGVGGPSAGLLIAVAVADLSSPEDLAAGRLVSGTGAVAPDGTVAAVGGVTDKVEAAEAAGATVFLVPDGQVDQARATGTTMRIVGVATVEEAVAALRDH